jgi:short-subunit dehydrogenase
MPTTLITGASGGIGLALARISAAHGDDLVLVARSADKLQTIADEFAATYKITAHVLPTDLSHAQSPQMLVDQVAAHNIQVDILINNAGFGDYGPFAAADHTKTMEMLQLNIATLTALTQLLLPGMLARRYGRIMNVASTAAFQPGPLMAVYYASKAYVLSFSEAVNEEVRGSGVSVTALCPGPTRTGFQAGAAMEQSRLLRLGLMDGEAVAQAGYRGMIAGKSVVIPGASNWLGAQLPRFSPRSLTARLVRQLQEREG